MKLTFAVDSVCDAAAQIDKDGNSFTRANNKLKSQFNENTSIFVRNLPEEVTDDELFTMFQQSGSVMNCQVSGNSHSKQHSLTKAALFDKSRSSEIINQSPNAWDWSTSQAKRLLKTPSHR